MSNVKISALPAATTPLTGTELVPLVQSGVTSQVAVSNIKTAPAGSTTQVQYNNAGAFGGISGVTTDGTRMTASTTIGVGNATPSTSGAGITFPATQSASTDVNTLDDYEEGTWTPTIIGTTTAGTATYAFQLGYYTKVGRMVQITGYVEWSAGSGSGAGMRMNGLPFTANANADSPISCQPSNITASALTIVNMNVRGGAAQCSFLEQPVGTGAMGNCAYDVAGSTYFAGTYWV